MSRKKQQTGRGRRRAPGRRRVPAATRPQIFTLAAFLVVASLVAGYLALSRPDDTTPTAAIDHPFSSGPQPNLNVV